MSIDHDLTREHIILYIYQVLKGLQCMHGAGVIHRDIKGANVMIDEQNIVKIIDFGLGGIESDWMTKDPIIIFYPTYGNQRAPEQYYRTDKITTKVDLWAVGTMLLEIWTDVDVTED